MSITSKIIWWCSQTEIISKYEEEKEKLFLRYEQMSEQ